MSDCIMILTGKSLESFAADGGSRAWKLHRARASKAEFAVFCHHAHASAKEVEMPHRSGWLVARITGIDPVSADRFRVCFNEFAEIEIPDLWNGGRNPIRYTSMEEIGIDPGQLDWRSLDEIETPARSEVEASEIGDTIRAEISRTRADLANALGLNPEDVRISISVREASLPVA